MAVDGECVKRERTDCPQSTECKTKQMCTPVTGVCGYSRKQCEESQACKIYGKCWPHVDGCYNLSYEDCKKSWICPTSNVCSREGRCERGRSGECEALSDAHCAQAEVCKTAGKCRAAGGVCVK